MDGTDQQMTELPQNVTDACPKPCFTMSCASAVLQLFICRTEEESTLSFLKALQR